MTPQRPGFDFRGRPLSAGPDGVAGDGAYRAGYEDGRQDAAKADRLEAVIAWAADYFGDTTQFPSGLAFALWTDADSPRCHCGTYPVDPDHCLTLFDRDDTKGCRHDPYEPRSGETGICRTCAAPIWWEPGTVDHRELVGWSDRIERGGDSLVCFKAVGYRHVPMGSREEAIYRAGFKAGEQNR